jgi:hypothetical protein
MGRHFAGYPCKRLQFEEIQGMASCGTVHKKFTISQALDFLDLSRY